MNNIQIKKMIELLDEQYIAGAEETKGPAKTNFAWSRYAGVAALLVLAGVLVLTNQFWSGRNKQAGSGYTQNTSAGATTITTEIATIPHWDELKIYEQYREGAINGVGYMGAGAAVDPAIVLDKKGNLSASGFDVYEDKTHTINAEWFNLKGIDPDCVVAVRFEGDDNFYSFLNYNHTFKTFAAMSRELDLKNHLMPNNFYQINLWRPLDGGNNTYSMGMYFYELTDSAFVRNFLLELPDAINKTDVELGFDLLHIGIDYLPAGQENIGFVFYENGYLATNLLWTHSVYDIGEKRVQQLIDYLKDNATLVRSVESEKEASDPQADPAEDGDISVGHEAPLEETTRGTTAP